MSIPCSEIVWTPNKLSFTDAYERVERSFRFPLPYCQIQLLTKSPEETLQNSHNILPHNIL